MKKVSTKTIRELLGSAITGIDGVRKVRGESNTWRFHTSYFYSSGNDTAVLETRVRNLFAGTGVRMELTNRGNHFHEFVGGAASGSAKDSFYYVEFHIMNK